VVEIEQRWLKRHALAAALAAGQSRPRPARGAPSDKKAGAKNSHPQRTNELPSDIFASLRL
jgi:hypothetical protein